MPQIKVIGDLSTDTGLLDLDVNNISCKRQILHFCCYQSLFLSIVLGENNISFKCTMIDFHKSMRYVAALKLANHEITLI